MIHSAALRLTLWYLGIIMLLSLSFSVFLYNVYSHELDRGLHHPPPTTFQLDDTTYNAFEQDRQIEYSQSLSHLRDDLIAFNLAILLFGGLVSYFLARRHMQPIEEALGAQTRFTADASHELRTPLTAMQTEIEVALRDPRLSRDAKAILESNLEETAKLIALSEGLLKLARENGKELLTETVSLKEIIEEGSGRNRKIAKLRSIELVVKDVPDIQLTGDKSSLIELISILVDNAIKYSADGKKVEIQAKAQKKSAVITIKDEGAGIKASDIPLIFNRFFRSDTSRSKIKVSGYGLGLSIAKKIVDLHHGSIDVKSTPGKGSIFTVRLPIN